MLALSVAGHRPLQALRLMEALNEVKDEPWFSDLMTSAVRVRNILQKAPDAPDTADPALLAKPAERALYDEVVRLEPGVREALNANDWKGLTARLSELSPVVSAFFEDVMVMDPDEKVRANRLALLRRCNALFKEVGDLGALKSQAQK